MGVKQITIEISGKCNAKCPYCAQARLRQDEHFGEIMSPILFEQIIDHLIKIGIINVNVPPNISLYNWGEPFLNKNINTILQILKDKNLKADISSNFIIMPNIDVELYPVINNVIFSLSGLTQESYGRIHGASVDKVIKNFDKFYENIQKYSPNTSIRISWHRYIFNESEFWEMYKRFNKKNILIIPVVAFLNDILKMKYFIRGELSEDFIKKAEEDIFFNYIKDDIIYNKKKYKNYNCPQLEQIVIDESGQLLLCCGITRYDSDFVLGNILDMTSEEILNRRLNHPFCNECVSLGISQFGHNTNTNFPSGGGLYSLKIKIHIRLRKIIGQILRNIPYGNETINIVRRIS